jgi:3-phosphoshikimate 1-carboxyvinyltransferase
LNLTVTPGMPLLGEVFLPGDKSISHRAALLAALAEGESRIEHFLVSGVTEAMLRALTALGVPWQLEGSTLLVSGGGLSGLKPPAGPIDCGNSATTIRLLAGALAAAGIPAVLDGSPGLRRRPMGRIVEPLQAMGVAIEAAPSGGAPLVLGGRPSGQRLKDISYTLPVASAQLKSCLLLAALAAGGPVVLCEPGPSRDHTERMLRSMGVSIEAIDPAGAMPALRVIPPDSIHFSPLRMTVPGDFSAAAFLLVAALVTPGSSLLLKGVGLNPSRTGLLDVLLEIGGDIRVSNPHQVSGEPVGDLSVRASALHGGTVSGPRVVRMIDEFPAFAVAAAFAHGRTGVSQAEELRYKESDRIGVLCERLRALGVQVMERPDGFIVDGTGQVHGGVRLDPQGDHRLAMALALAGLASRQPVTVENAGIISESFPDFPEVLRSLGADLKVGE